MKDLMKIIFGESLLDWHKRKQKEFQAADERLWKQLVEVFEEYNNGKT